MAPPSFDGTGAAQRPKQGFGAAALGQANPLQLVSPNPVSSMQANGSGSNMNQCRFCKTLVNVVLARGKKS